MNLVRWARRQAERAGPSPWPSMTLDQLPYWFGQFGYQGLGYGPTMIQTIQQNRETIAGDFTGFINGAYKTNGAIFAVMLARMMLFSEARFQWQRMNNGRPGQLFGTQDLRILEHPWPNATTGDLLLKAICDIDLAGNFYCTRVPRQRPMRGEPPSKIARLRPDWVIIIKGTTTGVPADPEAPNTSLANVWDPSAELVGYIYHPGGYGSGLKPKFYLPEEVAHVAPIPDPLATYRGMSWVQPILQEVLGDRAMTTHKIMYFEQGACQTLSSKVATPTGWTTMGEIQVGDEVVGQDGKPTRVLGVYPKGERDVYRLTFTGGASVECCEEHLWQVQSFADRAGAGRGHKGPAMQRVMSLRSIMDAGVRYPSGPHKWAIPLTEPVQYDDGAPLPLDPYILGAMLGDGHACRYAGLSTNVADAHWFDREFHRALPSGALAIHAQRKKGLAVELRFTRRPGTARENWLMGRLRDLRVADVVHHEKFVPELYMRASVRDREALLQGLIDTDGHISDGESGAVRFSSTSRRLAHQVVELVESLGGVASIKRRVRKDPNARVQWAVYFSRLPEEIVPVRLPRKRGQYRLSRRFVDRTRFLKSVEYVGRKPVQCIRVAARDGLYLTDRFVVTHNTPNLVVSLDTGKMNRETFQEWIELFEDEHSGAMNAFRTLYLGMGANATVVGANLRDLDYSAVQGQTELRIAAAGGMHPVILGLSEGLKASSLNNFANARRLTAEKTLRPLWRNFCGSMETIVPPPGGARLWYDDRDIPFLKEDAADLADVQLTTATAIRLLVDSGYDPDTVIAAVQNNDISLLKHTGLYSVQLQPPGTVVDPQAALPGQQPNGPPNPSNGNGKPSLPAGASGAVKPKVPRSLDAPGNVLNFAQALLVARKSQNSE